MEDRHHVLAMLADRIAEARTQRDAAPPDTAERRDAQAELQRAEEALTQFLTIGRLPGTFEEAPQGG